MFHPNTILPNIIAAQKKGQAAGIYSVCSAHPFVLESCFQQSLKDNSPLLIEATSNQVNQEGGYTGLIPTAFRDYVHTLAARFDFPRQGLILGGDHLGPNPWQNEPAARAMAKAKVLVQDYVSAGFSKIHLDASMKCADDAPTGDPAAPLLPEVAAARAAELALAAESAASSQEAVLYYIIGTEVPLPGGMQGQEERVAVTGAEAAQETIAISQAAFYQRGLEAAWQRVIAVVVQPGVEYGDETLFAYDRSTAAPLARFIENEEQLVYEAHSTDYQTRAALRQMVEDHFAILKVGPALTFAFREAVFALALIEQEWLGAKRGVSWSNPAEPSNIVQVLDRAMLAQPAYWQKYYPAAEPQAQLARKYSFSDRSRYYWPVPEVQQALARLLANLEEYPAPLTLLSQFLPVQYERVRLGLLENSPRPLIYHKIMAVLGDYAYACAFGTDKN